MWRRRAPGRPFGVDAFRSSEPSLWSGAPARPSPPRPEDPFGERTQTFRTGRPPLTVGRRPLGLFRGVNGFFGEFTVFERSVGLPEVRRS